MKKIIIGTVVAISFGALLTFTITFQNNNISRFRNEAKNVSKDSGIIKIITVRGDSVENCNPAILLSFGTEIEQCPITNGPEGMETTPSLLLMKDQDTIGYYYSPGHLTLKAIGNTTIADIHKLKIGHYLEMLSKGIVH